MIKAPTDSYKRIVSDVHGKWQCLLGTHRSDTLRNRKEVYKALNPDDDWLENVDYGSIRLDKIYMREIKHRGEGGWWQRCTKRHSMAVRATELIYCE